MTSPRPWSFPKGTRLNLLTVLRAGGGWTGKADITRVKVVRMRNSELTTTTENLQEIMDGKQADVPLENGDVIVVPPLGGNAEVITSGSVRSK